MNVLIIHQNFPAQFGALARALDAGRVVGLGIGERRLDLGPHVRYVAHGKHIPPWTCHSPTAEILAEHARLGRSAAQAMTRLRDKGFRPDVVIAHPSWGEALFLRDVYPDARFVAYLEYFYRSAGSDVDFDPEFPPPSADLPHIRFRNLPALLAFEAADLCVTPTAWQAGTFPPPIRRQLAVLHDGIDTDRVLPDPDVRLALPDGRMLTRADEVITYVSRSLEPYRGFHVFMRALPDLLRRRPRATVVLLGADDVSYGRAPGGGTTWRERLLGDVGGDLDPARVVFLGRVAYDRYRALLQVSRVHVYLTYPFVLSWSLLEAMASGCAIVASDTGPVTEVVEDGENGRLCGFFDRGRLVDLVEELAEDPAQRERLGRNARATIVERYDFASRILPRYRQLLADLAPVRRPLAT